jgi:hypothetical protein
MGTPSVRQFREFITVALTRHGLIESCGGIKTQTVWREANELAYKVHAILVDFGSTRKEILLNLFGDTRKVDTIVSPSWFYENIGSVIDSQLLLSELNKGTHVPSPTSVSQTIERARQLGLPVSQGGQGGGSGEITGGNEDFFLKQKQQDAAAAAKLDAAAARLKKKKMSMQSKLMAVGNAGRSPPPRANRRPVALLTPSGARC